MEQELAFRLQEDQIEFRTQVEIPVTTADFYFPIVPRPLLVFVDGGSIKGRGQMLKDEETRSLLRKKGYRVLELYYDSYSDNKSDELYQKILSDLKNWASCGA